MLMNENNHKLIFLDDKSNNKVYYMDLEKGKIINEYVIYFFL